MPLEPIQGDRTDAGRSLIRENTGKTEARLGRVNSGFGRVHCETAMNGNPHGFSIRPAVLSRCISRS